MEGAPGEVLVRAEGVSKKFCRNLEASLRYGFQDLVDELRARPRRSDDLRPHEFWSLKDVDLGLRRGDAVALIGKNGAGKSTLLQLLNGRLKLDQGRITVRGTTGLVTELGAGFNPVQTGRENVYNSGAVLGMSRERIDAAYHDIVAFAELEEAMEAPVQTYSSGMRARLGYAVVAHLDPDVLMGDEVLAVGDMAFRRKCLQHMVRYLKAGGTLVIVAHDLYTVQAICPRCVLLDQGRVVFDGETVDGFDLYYKMIQAPRGLSVAWDGAKPGEAPAEPVVIESVSIRGEDGGDPHSGRPARVEMRYRSREAVEAVAWSFTIHTPDRLVRIASGIGGFDNGHFALRQGEGSFSCLIPQLPLFAGTFVISGSILDGATKAPLAEFGRLGPACPFTVAAEKSEINNVRAYLGNLIVLDIHWNPS
jgi:lipopolysaccharide transport system ATP-binding protein